MSTKARNGWIVIVAGLVLMAIGFIVPVMGWFVTLPLGGLLVVVGAMMVKGGGDELGEVEPSDEHPRRRHPVDRAI